MRVGQEIIVSNPFVERLVTVKKCRRDTVLRLSMWRQVPTFKPRRALSFVFVSVTDCGGSARFLLQIDSQKARLRCKSSAHGAARKVGSDSSEKKLRSKIDERRIVSVSSMSGLYGLDGPPVNGTFIHTGRPAIARGIRPRVFAGWCDQSCGYVWG